MFELPKSYDPQAVDPKWVAFWEEKNCFVANPKSKKPPYCIVIPPPNVTGVLHMGHALVNTLIDILIRWRRMCGDEVLWVPGTDHAGIATQSVVERHLFATLGKRREEFSREEFLQKVWEWKERHEATILGQLKRLGSSCDFSRLRFTMDEGCSSAVRLIFKKLFDEGLIIRGEYLVNWDPVTKTALADDEVEYEERNSFLWYFKYPLEEGGHLTVATTRPETLLGDVALAVHPNDTRYAPLIGKRVKHPLLHRLLPVIADHRVDPQFGTGVVKITPAHDATDYAIGQDHKLPQINILTPDGRINENGGAFKGLPREEARQEVVKALQELGLVECIKPHLLRVGLSYRSKAVIEPYLSKQWFIKMERFAHRLKEVVTSGEFKLLPPEWRHTYFHWIDNLRDWCISRQLWWGHQIPIWTHKQDPSRVICYADKGVPPEVAKEPELWQQDPDVLDTWFSSALWPFSTLGWPENSADLATFYPNATLITGHDILFFWVARMVMMGDYAIGKLPFAESFLHGLIYGKSYWKVVEGRAVYITGAEKREYDLGKALPPGVESKWEKLSKSKGNVIDPLEMIAEYGTDAVRMTLAASANQTPQIDLDRRRFEEFKNFANKIWNGARFVLLNLEGLSSEELAEGIDLTRLELEDAWILTEGNRLIEKTSENLRAYRFDEAALGAYNFFWNLFCADYVEIVKPVLFGKRGEKADQRNKQKILVHTLLLAIRLLHPMAPFITEELFALLKERFPSAKELQPSCCACASFPTPLTFSTPSDVEESFAWMKRLVYTVRNIRGEMALPPSEATDLYLIGADRRIEEHQHILRSLVRIQELHFCKEPPELGFAATGALGDLRIVLPLPEQFAKKEQQRLEKLQETLQKNLEKLNLQLSNSDFLQKANPQLIETTKLKRAQMEQELTALRTKLNK